MSDPVTKGLKRSASRSSNASASAASAKSTVKNRTLTGKSAKISPISKRAVADKAPALKATKSKTTAPSKSVPAKSALTRSAKKPKSDSPKITAKSTAPAKAAIVKQPISSPVNTPPALPPPVKSAKQYSKPSPPAIVPRQPTRDEAAALKAFERAHREFARGHFGEARSLFVALIEQFAGVSEITARARTYLNIAEARLRTDPGLPRDADSLYDRGVIELNRGEYVAAQEMFERALKREPEAAHIHYGLAATRARLGSIAAALNSLDQALNLQPSLRVRAQHDQDLTVLRNEPDFEKLVFTQR